MLDSTDQHPIPTRDIRRQYQSNQNFNYIDRISPEDLIAYAGAWPTGVELAVIPPARHTLKHQLKP